MKIPRNHAWTGSVFFAALCAASAALVSAAEPPVAPKVEEIPASSHRPVVVRLDAAGVRAQAAKVPPAHLPDGYVLSVAAASPLVTHPIAGCVDDKGRLFLGDAVGVNSNKAQLAADPPNRVLMLEDPDGDGSFDRSTVFADKMTFPQGAQWLNGSLYVASPPGIWKLTATDGDGVADQREMIVAGFDYTGNAADVHGPFLHPNGRLYWCHGRKGFRVTDTAGRVLHGLHATRFVHRGATGWTLQQRSAGPVAHPFSYCRNPPARRSSHHPDARDDRRHDGCAARTRAPFCGEKNRRRRFRRNARLRTIADRAAPDAGQFFRERQ
jgi:hypothetical protein